MHTWRLDSHPFQTRTSTHLARLGIRRLQLAERLDVDAFPSGLAAVVSKCATPAMLDFASALEAQIARRAEASSAPNVVVYEAGSAASS
ncbi:hypothetical protein PUN4_1000057 [Paraburkholderia unamae]|nr:hypothetical protein PUN4_1000057 [Paraburkholderia unamae]